MTEIPFSRVAHYYSQHDYGPSGWQRTVSKGEINETATKYVVVPPVGEVSAHLKDTLVVHELDKSTIRLEISGDLPTETVVLLAKTALSEYEREHDAIRRGVKIVAYAPHSLENPEINSDTSEVFVNTLGLTGDSFTENDEIVYTGTLREALGAIDDTIEWRMGRKVMRSLQLPELPSQAA